MQAANGMRDMALVHQIVVDQDFKLKPIEPPPDSIQKKVKDTMQQAFWDILRNELQETPPNYTQALVLLEDIKKVQYIFSTYAVIEGIYCRVYFHYYYHNIRKFASKLVKYLILS